MKLSFGAFLVMITVLAAVFVLVRPASQGPTFISGIGNGLASILGAGTGGGTF